MIFEIQDKTGRRIHLTMERWKHILNEHPILFDQIENIEQTLITPLTFVESTSSENVKYYYRYYKNIKLKAKCLLVVVKYLNGDGFVIISFYVDIIK